MVLKIIIVYKQNIAQKHFQCFVITKNIRFFLHFLPLVRIWGQLLVIYQWKKK